MYIQIRKEKKRSYTGQIYGVLREKILKGELKEGSALPSTRELSAELTVSRNTVLTAYDMLVSEGFAQSKPGSGIFVCRGAKAEQHAALTDSMTATLADDLIGSGEISFDSGIPALELFPRNKWNRFVSRAFLEAPVSALGYDDPQGRPELRKVLAGYLKKTRGISCSPDQIIITSGVKQGLTLAAKCLLDSTSEVVLEDPSNRNVYQIFSYHTKNIIPVPVDEEGIDTGRLPKGGNPALLFTTASHQFPMGGILTIQRRLELVRYARETGCILIEDDYDSEFRYDVPPASSLFELAPERVIYAGTFSKLLYPSLRIGYLVLPESLTDRFRKWKRLSDHHTNSISQLALMRFIESGDLERHVRHMKKVYKTRRDVMTELLDKYFHQDFEATGMSAGMHMILRLKGASFSPDLIRKIREAGVYAVPVEDHAIIKGCHSDQMILGYAHLSRSEAEMGLQRIKSLI